MNKKLTNLLILAFPKLFRDRDKPPTESLMCFGFECDDGWYDLIYDLCNKIEKLDPIGIARAMQVKEKYGSLRFYVSSASDEVFKEIDAAEKESEKTCERCGRNGKLRQYGSWLKTLCNKCHRTYKKEREG